MNKQVFNISPRESNLKRKIRKHLREIGFHKESDGTLKIRGSGKDVIRKLHGSHRNDRLEKNRQFLSRHTPLLIDCFASGREVEPQNISPALERVTAGTWQSELFRMASLTWSVPVSNGFGRRLRYLVWDDNNRKLIGLIAIGDPVFNLAVRDNLIGWNAEDRSARLVNVMDAFVLGALPPYNALLGGKMVACLVRSREIYDDFRRVYGVTTGVISQQQKNAHLLCVTTSSSMGRSSVYNRLKLDGTEYFRSVGYTGGWGHFHIPDGLFYELRSYLREIGHPYADSHRFGAGPNWRLRTTRVALKALGLQDTLLRHGVQREVFVCWPVSNGEELLRTGKGRPDISSLLSVRQISQLALERWILPRSLRQREYLLWTTDDLRLLFRQSPLNHRDTHSKCESRHG